MPALHLQVCAGFANRLRALVAGICFAEDHGLQLVIHWFPKSPECACRFSSVLDPESLPKTVKVAPEDLYMPADIWCEEKWKEAYANWDKTSDLNWKSYGIFYTNAKYDHYLRQIKPSPFVKEFLNRRCASVDWENAIGVHIRRGDNTRSIKHSPLEAFAEVMRQNEKAFYVVATDDATVKQSLLDEFGPRCVFPAMTLSRRTDEGMIQGVADFFALSQCTSIWGSYGSSFSELSARYGNCKMTVVYRGGPPWLDGSI